jgi:hypothetical protein
MEKTFLKGAEPKIELWPVLDQADTLPSELRRTLIRALTELRRKLYWGARKNFISQTSICFHQIFVYIYYLNLFCPFRIFDGWLDLNPDSLSCQLSHPSL